MEVPKKTTGILYLDRTNFTYFDTLVGGSIIYQYPGDVISDLEVINEDLLNQQVTSLIQENTLTPTQVVVVLSPGLVFEKKIPLPTEQQKDTDEIQKFIDTVPFETVSFTKVSLTDGIQVIAASTNFFMSIKQVFEKQGFIIVQALPVTVFGEDVTNGMTIDIAGRIISKYESMKQYSFLEKQEVILPTEKKLEIVPHEKKSQNRAYILGGVFIILVGVLIVMLLLQK